MWDLWELSGLWELWGLSELWELWEVCINGNYGAEEAKGAMAVM